MKVLFRTLSRLLIGWDCRGQDMVEYALLGGFVAIAAGVFAPGMADSINLIYSKLASKLVEAGG